MIVINMVIVQRVSVTARMVILDPFFLYVDLLNSCSNYGYCFKGVCNCESGYEGRLPRNLVQINAQNMAIKRE
jgi:hypothetical protein